MQTASLKGARLSLQQERLWSFQKENQAYRIQCAVWIDGMLDRRAFHSALVQVIKQHEILHTIFYPLPGMDTPVQIINPIGRVKCPVISLELITSLLQHTLPDIYFSQLHREAFDIARGPLVRTFLVHLSQETHLFLFSIPALCADLTTIPLFLNELIYYYNHHDIHDHAEDTPLQYIDVSAWQNTLQESENAKVANNFWRSYNFSDISSLPFTPQTCSTAFFDPHTITITISQILLDTLEALAHAKQISSTALLLASWQIVLQRLIGDSNILLGIAYDGRIYEELAPLPGLYMRVVPLRMEIESTRTFEQAAIAIEQELQKTTRWQSYFAWPAESRTQDFFPICFEHVHVPVATDASSIQFSLAHYISYTEPFVLKLNALHIGTSLQLNFSYDARYLSSALVTQIAANFHTFLQNACTQTQRPLHLLPVLTLEEQEQLLQQSKANRLPIVKNGLHQLFEEQVAHRPLQMAVIDGREQLTYEQLHRRTNQLAHILRQKGIGPGVLVGLYLQRSIQMIISVLAVLKAGGAYIPLDTESPVTRLTYQLQDMHAPTLVTEQALLSQLPPYQGQVLCLEAMSTEIEQAPRDNLSLVPHPVDPAYIIYTSGSTGFPKGVMISQQSIVNYTLALCHELACEPGWHFATVSTLAADLGNTAIFCSLASGGCLHILDYATVTSGAAMAHWIEKHPIDVLKIVPSHLSALLAHEDTGRLLPRQALILGGEALSPRLLEQVQRLPGSCAVYNHYGPTETTIGALVNPLGRIHTNAFNWSKHPITTVPLGRPIQNSEVYILDRYLHLVPPGGSGELYIGGVGLALSYVQQPEQTALRFIPHPFSDLPGARLYRTGDHVRLTLSGQREFIGRVDNQIKLRGYRIEPGEIEAKLKQHENVWDCAVLLREDQSGEPSIAAYIVPLHQPEPSYREMRTFMQIHVPNYMIPASFTYLKDIPLTTNGKIDRSLLPTPDLHQENEEAILNLPRSPIEDALLEIWNELLPAATIGIHHNFFQLGGHSLLATQVISRIRMMWQVELPITGLFETPTIAGLAQKVSVALHSQQHTELPPLVPVARTQELPLSFAQQRLWFLDQLEASNIAYLLPRSRRFYGSLQVQALERSLREIVLRHEILRTTFHARGGYPVQIIHGIEGFHLPLIDLCAFAPERRKAIVQYLAQQEARRTCNLERGPLLRTYLLRLEPEEHVFLLTMHHIISDGWSNEIFTHELATLYRAFASGKSSPLPPLPIQYADFALWQRQWLRGEVLEAQLAYWRKQLEEAPPLELATDRPRPPTQSFKGALYTTSFPLELQTQLLALAQHENVTLFILLLAAFQCLLARYTGQTDICIGTPIANRTYPNIERLIGFFVNTLVLRSDLSGNPSFLQVLNRVRAVALGAYTYQDVPFEQLVEELQPKRDMSRHPFFQVMFGVQHTQQVAEPVTRKQTQSINIEHDTTKFDLTLNVVSSQQGFHCGVEYSTDLFDEATICALITHWQILLEGIVAAPDTPIAELPLLSNKETEQFLVTWNATRKVGREGYCLHTLFTQQVARTPDAIAVIYEDCSLSYAYLEQKAHQLAHHLQVLGVAPEILVGVALTRSPLLLISFLAILKAGGGYVPIDPAYPLERCSYMLADAQVSLLITTSASRERLYPTNIQICYLDQIWAALAHLSSQLPVNPMLPDTAAYIIYTSGSTGKPKGVVITHWGLMNLFQVQQQAFKLDAESRVLQFASLSFDASIWEIVMALLSGACLTLASQEHLLPGPALQALLQERACTILTIPPSSLAVLAYEELPALTTIVVAGEACPAELVRRWAGGRRFWNAYGPTEATICASMTECTEAQAEQRKPGIGGPIENVQLYVLDGFLHPVPVGVPGELYIAGIGLARGYLRHPEITADRFIPHPFSQEPGCRLYKTGDRARYRPDATLEFLQRLDTQVKIRGYRIELGEIEHVLSKHPEVHECAVLVQGERLEDPRLVAYIVSTTLNAQLVTETLRSFLSQVVPEYMIPAHFVLLESLPLNPNGKIDHAALLSLEFHSEHEGTEEESVLTPVEELLLRIWCDILDNEHIGIHDNFYDLGGHSLDATRIFAHVGEVMQVTVPLQTLFEAPTIAGLAQRIEAVLRDAEQVVAPPLLPVAHTQPLPLSFAQQRLWFLDRLDPGNTAYLVRNSRRFSGRLDLQALEESFATLVQRHESLRTTFLLLEEQPVQVIHPTCALPLSIVDISGLDQARREKELSTLATCEARLPFSLQHGPLLRIMLLRLGHTEHILLCTLHHIISDGWSNEVFLRELTILYRATTSKAPPALPALPIQYADFAVWQRQWLQGDMLTTHVRYWKKQLAGVTPLKLPTDKARPTIQNYRGAIHHFDMPAPLSQALLDVSHQEEVTLFMTLLAAFQVLLHRSSGQEDIVVGTDVANRNRVEVEGVIGFFINQLVLRSNLAGDPPFRNFLKQVRSMAVQAYIHQDLPFEKVVEAVQPERSLQAAPLFQVKLLLQDTIRKTSSTRDEASLPDVSVRPFSVFAETVQLDIILRLFHTPHGLSGAFTYRADLFEEATIRRMAQQFVALLESISSNPDTRLSKLALLSTQANEQQQMLLQDRNTVTFNRFKTTKPQPISVQHETLPARKDLSD